MNQGSTIFSQLMEHASRFALDRCIRRYRGNYRVRSFSCRDQFLVMAFAQLTYRESLRDIKACSPNAVKAQIWIAISVYVLVAIVKKRLALISSRISTQSCKS
jgi:hypothetical protein